ncbi:MAG TPA: hypothetical protein VN577_05015 [Terriglobales bacterium]|nr:hypothetical protein [Terriglobales bacterium]
MMESPTNVAAELIKAWAKHAPVRSRCGLDWGCVREFLQAAIRESESRRAELVGLLDRSDAVFAPLQDPLRADAGLNRWLRQEREEAYSDWLAWILQQLEPADIIYVLRLEDSYLADVCRGINPTVERERMIPDGRLDLALWFGDLGLIVVEVKVTSAEEAEIDKQAGYSDWIRQQNVACTPESVLLIVDSSAEVYEGFKPLRWSEICLRLRQTAVRRMPSLGLVKAAMCIAFVGAVETNLLSMSLPTGLTGGQALTYGRTADHLRQFLET